MGLLSIRVMLLLNRCIE